MFSQYSWWDFIKFVLALAIPYYGFVIIKYYREDIREWLSNQGQPRPQLAVQTLDEDDPVSMFTVTDYSKADAPQSVAAQQKPADWIPSPSTVAQPSARRQSQPVQDNPEVELQGPAIDAAAETTFSLPVHMQSENPAEQSIDAIVDAAGRITADEQGRFSPINADDKPAAKIADIINQQQGNPLDSFAFNR